MNRPLAQLGVLLALTALAPANPRQGKEKDSAVGTSYRIPYLRTQTNHILIRVRINGKGPFNFLVDSGAPALYIATATARKVGLKAPEDGFWAPVDRLEFEGGARLSNLKARIEDPFQLVGMNALGLPGATIDGILGFTILARFRLEIDATQDRMTWTRVDYTPQEPFIPPREPGEQAAGQPMNLIGPLAKLLAPLIGKQPADRLFPRGFFGLELQDAKGGVRVAHVLDDTPASRAGIKAGDLLIRVHGHEIKTAKGAREVVSDYRLGTKVPIFLKRGAEDVDVVLIAGEGL